MDIEITAMNRVTEPKPNRANDVIVANFDARIGPFFLSHCALVQLHRGGDPFGMTVWAPRITYPTGKRGIVFEDKALKAEVKDKALGVYRALGGEVIQTAG